MVMLHGKVSFSVRTPEITQGQFLSNFKKFNDFFCSNPQSLKHLEHLAHGEIGPGMDPWDEAMRGAMQEMPIF